MSGILPVRPGQIFLIEKYIRRWVVKVKVFKQDIYLNGFTFTIYTLR